MVKGQAQTVGLWKNVVGSISLDSFVGKLPNLVQWMLLECTWPLLMLKLQGQRSRSKRWSLHKWCLLSIFRILCYKVAKFCTVNPPREELFPIFSLLHWQGSRYHGCQLRVDNPLYICNPFEFCTGGRGFLIHFLFFQDFPFTLFVFCLVSIDLLVLLYFRH